MRTATAAPAEQFAEQVGRVAAEIEAGAAPGGGAAKAARSRVEAPKTTTAAKARWRFGLAVGVDLAAIIFGALVDVGQDRVRRRHVLEPRKGCGIAGVGIGVVRLGELAVRLFNVGRARAARDAEG